MISGANIVMNSLKKNGVGVLFEYPGGNIAPILDEIKRDSNIDIILTRNDQAASLMADAYSRTSGKIGVCMATVGPGATNLITGVANAYCDSIPMVIITGQVGKGSLKRDKNIRQLGFQEIDIVSLVKPITKYAVMVENTEDLENIIDQAFITAKEGRPGPVWIDIPMDVQRKEIEWKFKDTAVSSLIKEENIKEDDIKEVISLLLDSKKPVIISGGGVITSNAEEELSELSSCLQIPVANTLMGQGSFDQNNYLSLGFMGCYGNRAVNKTLFEADTVLVLGSRLDLRAIGTETSIFSQNKKIIHIDIDKSEINNRVKADIYFNSDIKYFLHKMLNYIKTNNLKSEKSEWLEKINLLKEKYTFEKEYNLKTEYESVRPQYIIKAISKFSGDKTVITTDVGQNQMWTAQFFKFSNERRNITSGGLGNMGYGLPAAIASKYALKEYEVINITGDGSFQMNLQELAVAVQYKLPIKIFILHNKTLGLVKQFQDKTFIGKATSTVLDINPDFLKIAESYGIKGFRIDSEKNIDTIVKEVLDYNGIAVVDCIISSDELVLPELEGGKSLDNQYPYI